jgi:hypothetical protein
MAADNNAEPKVLRPSRRIYNEACSILNDINKFLVHHTITQRFSQTRHRNIWLANRSLVMKSVIEGLAYRLEPFPKCFPKAHSRVNQAL